MEINNIIETSCDKLLVGKTWWKAVMLPSLLVGVGVIGLTKKQAAKLQIIQNRVYRKILGGNKATSVAVLRREIGSSLMISRLIESKLKLMKSMLETENVLVKRIAKRVLNDENNS